MTYHYRQVSQDKRESLIEKAKKIIVDGGFKVILGNVNIAPSITNI